MRVHVLTLRYSQTLGGFDDTPIRDLTRDRELLAFREHFFAVGEVPHLACVLELQEPVVDPAVLDRAREAGAAASRAPQAERHDRHGAPISRPADRPGRDGSGSRPDRLAGLSEDERALFNTFRDWRAERAHEEGVPRYVILTDAHIVEIIRRRPESPTALGHIRGIGPKIVARHGAAILRVLHGAPAADGAAEPGAVAPIDAVAPTDGGPDHPRGGGGVASDDLGPRTDAGGAPSAEARA